MAAGWAEHTLFDGNPYRVPKAYHSGAGVNGDQNIACNVIDVDEKKRISHTNMPLSPQSTVTWIGFSEVGE